MNKNKKNKPKWQKKGDTWVATLSSTAMDQVLKERRFRREEEIKSGIFNAGVGTGAHEGTKRDKRRKERRQGRQQAYQD